jgi:hypothetical protein
LIVTGLLNSLLDKTQELCHDQSSSNDEDVLDEETRVPRIIALEYTPRSWTRKLASLRERRSLSLSAAGRILMMMRVKTN